MRYTNRSKEENRSWLCKWLIKMDLSIITVTYQSKEFIPYLIGSVMTCSVQKEYEHFIVDNGSRDGTVELIKERYGDAVHFIANERNMGFAAANDAALKRAKGRYLLFLNPDMELEAFSMDQMVAWMDDHPEVGIAGCKLLDVNGFPNAASSRGGSLDGGIFWVFFSIYSGCFLLWKALFYILGSPRTKSRRWITSAVPLCLFEGRSLKNWGELLT